MIGIIGFGRFGKLMASYLAKDFNVLVYNRSDKTDAIQKAGASSESFSQVCSQPIVILAVPISYMQDTLKAAAPHLKKDALIADVCSVKILPVQWMNTLLPDNVSILATHPMFGPDSAAASLKERKIVLCPERIKTAHYKRIYKRIIVYLESKELIVIEATPEEHDRKIALSLALTHFIGRSLSEFGTPELDIDTEGYRRLLHILGVVENDTWQLFYDMNKYNPYAREQRELFIASMQNINARLGR